MSDKTVRSELDRLELLDGGEERVTSICRRSLRIQNELRRLFLDLEGADCDLLPPCGTPGPLLEAHFELIEMLEKLQQLGLHID